MKRAFFMIMTCFFVIISGRQSPAQSTLQIDFSTFLGGSSVDYAIGIDLDSAGNIYVGGGTLSTDFPLENPYQGSRAGDKDAFVAKLSSSGSVLIYSTYLGGAGEDTARGLAVDDQDGAWLTGYTVSDDFPTASLCYQPSRAGYEDVFVTRLRSTGASLYASTYLGGLSDERAEAIEIDAVGYAYVTGYTDSLNFPTKNPYQASLAGFKDCFVSQLTTSASDLYYSTYLGGAYLDYGYDVAVDEDYYAYVVGESGSIDFPTLNPYQASIAESGYGDAFACKLSVSGSALLFSTYLGGEYADGADGVAIDNGENLYLTGCTQSALFPVYSAYQMGSAGYNDAFVTCLNSAGSSLYYSTYLGGSDHDMGFDIKVDPDYGDTYITGYTVSSDFPTLNSYQPSFSGGLSYGDAFLVNLGWEGNQLHGSTYLGGSSDDFGYAVVRDGGNQAYVAGSTESTNFPIRNPYQASLNGTSSDGFITKFFWGTAPPGGDYHTDFNGDGTSDIAVFRENSGLWAVRNLTRIYFGNTFDYPVPGDYNGNGTTEIAVFRDSSGLWAIRGVTRVYFGGPSDMARSGDYDGDGTWEAGIFRPGSGLWAIRGVTRLYFGASFDNPIPGYYSGGSSLEPAVFRPSSGLWAIRNLSRLYFGSSADTPAAGNYTGSAAWIPAVFNSPTGLWAVRGTTRYYFGGSLDRSVPADYDGNDQDDIGIFRESSGLWAARGLTRLYFGSSGDIPVTR